MRSDGEVVGGKKKYELFEVIGKFDVLSAAGKSLPVVVAFSVSCSNAEKYESIGNETIRPGVYPSPPLFVQ